jgi:isocitrate lyase
LSYTKSAIGTEAQRICNAFPSRRSDSVESQKNPGVEDYIDYFTPVVADVEGGFGGVLKAYELAESMIEAGDANGHL